MTSWYKRLQHKLCYTTYFKIGDFNLTVFVIRVSRANSASSLCACSSLCAWDQSRVLPTKLCDHSLSPWLAAIRSLDKWVNFIKWLVFGKHHFLLLFNRNLNDLQGQTMFSLLADHVQEIRYSCLFDTTVNTKTTSKLVENRFYWFITLLMILTTYAHLNKAHTLFLSLSLTYPPTRPQNTPLTHLYSWSRSLFWRPSAN